MMKTLIPAVTPTLNPVDTQVRAMQKDRPTLPRTVPGTRDSISGSAGRNVAPVDGSGRTLASMDFSMLFDASDGATQAAYADTRQAEPESGYDTVTVYVRILRRLTAPRSALEFKLMKTLKKVVTKLGKGDVGDDAHVHSLQQHLMANGFPVHLSTTPGACGSAALLNLRHTFLWLKPTAVFDGLDFQENRIILEPDIKAHFVISRATPNYQRLVDALPEQFVGTHHRLVELVNFMCEQMTASFRESGMSVPPWRQPKSILSKWFIPAVTDTSTHGAASASGGHAVDVDAKGDAQKAAGEWQKDAHAIFEQAAEHPVFECEAG